MRNEAIYIGRQNVVGRSEDLPGTMLIKKFNMRKEAILIRIKCRFESREKPRPRSYGVQRVCHFNHAGTASYFVSGRYPHLQENTPHIWTCDAHKYFMKKFSKIGNEAIFPLLPKCDSVTNSFHYIHPQ